MNESRRQNIIIFSAGTSEQNGNLKRVKSFFSEEKYRCSDWRELFTNAKNKQSISLLPMLIKKIPTFDFAIILGDGVDALKKFRGRKIKRKERIRIMRDNVLFECGMCIMALGKERVILLIEDDVRIPEDLIGGVGKLGVHHYKYSNERHTLSECLHQTLGHMIEQEKHLSPVVIGAAISIADGYLTNFILRFWENIGNGFFEKETRKKCTADLSRIHMNICLPEKNDGQIGKKSKDYYMKNNFSEGLIEDGGPRSLSFWYKEDKGTITIKDFPTTMTASYDTVRDILHLHADEENHDTDAEERFLTKERDSFKHTLEKLMKVEMLNTKLRGLRSYKDDNGNVIENKVNDILKKMNRVSIEDIVFD